jgi:hypothetical protein
MEMNMADETTEIDPKDLDTVAGGLNPQPLPPHTGPNELTK